MNCSNFRFIRHEFPLNFITLHSYVIPYFQCRLIQQQQQHGIKQTLHKQKPKIAHAIIIATAIRIGLHPKID